MSTLYHSSHRALQQRFDTQRLADRIEERLVQDFIDDRDKAYIESRDQFFLATADARGRPSCSYKGGDPGFVHVLDPHTLVFPNYDGNGMYLSMGNVGENPNVGLLFIDFENPSRLRLNGVASLEPASSVKPEFPGAQFIVRVTVREVFPNCPRYIHKMKQLERSRFVPQEAVAPPVPEWKRSEWACDVLPANDPARSPKR